MVEISSDGLGFTKDGQQFVPFGCNYYDPNTIWDPKTYYSPHLWLEFDKEVVNRHFSIMEELGINTIRVFLTVASFFKRPPHLNKDGIRKFDIMLKLAEKHNILLHPSGPDHWEGMPRWWEIDHFANKKAVDNLCIFWQKFVGVNRDSDYFPPSQTITPEPIVRPL